MTVTSVTVVQPGATPPINGAPGQKKSPGFFDALFPPGFQQSLKHIQDEVGLTAGAMGAAGLLGPHGPANEAQMMMAKVKFIELVNGISPEMGNLIKTLMGLGDTLNPSRLGTIDEFAGKLDGLTGKLNTLAKATEGIKDPKEAATTFKTELKKMLDSGEIKVPDKDKFLASMDKLIDTQLKDGKLNHGEINVLAAEMAGANAEAGSTTPKSGTLAVAGPVEISTAKPANTESIAGIKVYDLNNPKDAEALGLDKGKLVAAFNIQDGALHQTGQTGSDGLKATLGNDVSVAVVRELGDGKNPGPIVGVAFFDPKNPENKVYAAASPEPGQDAGRIPVSIVSATLQEAEVAKTAQPQPGMGPAVASVIDMSKTLGMDMAYRV